MRHRSVLNGMAIVLAFLALFLFANMAAAGCGGSGGGEGASSSDRPSTTAGGGGKLGSGRFPSFDDIELTGTMSLRPGDCMIDPTGGNAGDTFDAGKKENIYVAFERRLKEDPDFARRVDQHHREDEARRASRWATTVHIGTRIVEITDQAGVAAQTALNFVPGVGTGWTVGLDSGRAFANAFYRVREKGGGWQDAAKAGLMAATVQGGASLAFSKTAFATDSPSSVAGAAGTGLGSVVEWGTAKAQDAFGVTPGPVKDVSMQVSQPHAAAYNTAPAPSLGFSAPAAR